MVQTKAEKAAWRREYYQKNKEKMKEKNAEYYKNNKEQAKEYYESEKGKKSYRISHWKCRGVICDDFEALYNQYINTPNCDSCNIELTEDKVTTPTTRCLDHSHETGEFRNVVCHSCNVRIG
tara:strand:+ start:353 stop:718 length:366 start_codon:yes stop_codon:yes gene_type:complete